MHEALYHAARLEPVEQSRMQKGTSAQCKRAVEQNARGPCTAVARLGPARMHTTTAVGAVILSTLCAENAGVLRRKEHGQPHDQHRGACTEAKVAKQLDKLCLLCASISNNSAVPDQQWLLHVLHVAMRPSKVCRCSIRLLVPVVPKFAETLPHSTQHRSTLPGLWSTHPSACMPSSNNSARSQNAC